ncbi:hypothetical protein ACFO5K_04775 [Nocardia halotolerans]|uniref:Copper chaperone PCu(A)C n=1 Tax=Nocardia halotolerans TaxID=1755878 RepID=A0ABV8VEC5_9NOCA
MVSSRRMLMVTALSIAVAAAGCADEAGENSSHARGSEGVVGAITVQNAYLVPDVEAGTCVVQHDGPAELSFTATNRGDVADRLTKIETDAAASVQLPGEPEKLVVAAGGGLAAGQPIEQPDASEPIAVRVRQLEEWVQPGRNVDMRFTFENAGTLDLAVPVDACPTQQTP